MRALELEISSARSAHGALTHRQWLRRRSVEGFEGRRGFWALADQGVVSGGNFITSILLARQLSQHDFGCFALLFDIILILNSLTGAVVWYPLSMKGAAGGRGRIRRYTAASIVMTSSAMVPLSLGIVITAGLMTRNAAATAAVLLAMVGWQLQETARRGLTAQCRFRDAIPGDLISYPGQVAALLLLSALHRLNLTTAFGAIGVTSLLAFGLQSMQVGLKRLESPHVLRLWWAFWKSGRWMLLTNLASIVSIQVFSWVLVGAKGFGENGSYQSVVNLLRVSNPIIAALSGVMLPATARERVRGGLHSAFTAAGRYAAQGAAILLPYYLLLLIVPGLVLRLMYGANSPYVGLGNPLRLYVVGCTIFFAAQMLMNFMSAVDAARSAFRAEACTMVVTLLVSLPLTAKFGIVGVTAGIAVSALARFLAALLMVRGILRTESKESRPAEPAAIMPILAA